MCTEQFKKEIIWDFMQLHNAQFAMHELMYSVLSLSDVELQTQNILSMIPLK